MSGRRVRLGSGGCGLEVDAREPPLRTFRDSSPHVESANDTDRRNAREWPCALPGRLRASGPSPQPPAPSRSRAPLRSCVSAALLLAAAGSASAANWEVAPLISGGYRYSDNYRLSLPEDEIDVSGAEADAQVTFRTVDPRTLFSVTPRVRATAFPSESDEDSTDYFLSSVISDTTPRRSIGAAFDFAREDVVRSELPEAGDDGGDLGDPDGGDSGRSLLRNERDLIVFVPFFNYDLSQRQRLELQARYLDADFDRDGAGELQDFSEVGASVGWRMRYSERSSFLVRGAVAQYDTTFETDAVGADVEWGREFSPTSRMYVRLGARQTRPENGDDDTNLIAGIGGRWNSQRNVLFLDLTRSIEPISAGTVVERHQLRVRVDHDISQRVALTIAARGSHDEEIEGGGSYPTRKFASGEVGLEWRLQRYLALRTTYNRRWQDYADEPDSRNANGFLISLVYEPKRPE